MFSFILFTAVLNALDGYAFGQDNGSLCYNKFEYEYHVLQKLVQLENENKDLKTTIDNLKSISNPMDNTDGNTTLSTTYIRWGRSNCPDTGAELVYEGYAAGDYFSHPGGGAEYLCLPRDPEWNQYTDTADDTRGLLYGVEYQTQGTFLGALTNHNAPCAVCRVLKSNTMMIPGRKTCYSDWTAEYTGYLVSAYYNHASSSSYACLDENPEALNGGEADTNGALFHLVEGRCGTLKCPPYVNGRELACVVCSK